MKKLALFFLILLVFSQLALLSACADPTAQPQPEPQPEEPPVTPIVTVSGPQDPYAHQLTLDGQAYSLPVPYAQLADDGWLGSWEEDATLDANSTIVSVTLRKDGNRISTSFLNPSSTEQALEDCYVGSITVFAGEAELSLPGGLGFGLTGEQLLQVYGQPSETYEGNYFEEFTYSQTEEAKLQFRLDSESGLVDDITIQNFDLPLVEEPVYEAARPQLLESYRTPDDLSGSWDSFMLRYGGDLYQLPAPLEAFLDNGWELEGDDGEPIAARAISRFVTLHQDEQTLRVMLQNLDHQAQPLIHCFVYTVFYDRNGAVVPIELSGGITEESSIEDLLVAYGEPDDEHLSADGNRRFYTYGDFYQGLEIIEDLESGQIIRIEIKNAL